MSPSRDCTPRPLGSVAESPDPIDLAVQVFTCANQVVVASPNTPTSVIDQAVTFATANRVPLLVSSTETQTNVDETIEALGATPIKASTVDTGMTDDAGDPTATSQRRQLTYVLPENPTLEQRSLLPTLAAGGVNVEFVQPGDDQALADLDSSSRLVFSSDFESTDKWRARRTEELPGGGYELFPDRRIIAFYGNPTTPLLGLLGEQGPEQTIDRVQAEMEKYKASERPTLGGFELISTVATAAPGDDNTYSRKMELELLRPWIDAAVENDFYVILDLQPGRTDFLTQAKIYEKFLVLPNVGLALDPEWRLKPDEVHLRQIGGVDAAEVNSIVDYLAELVREHNLPQKALVLHQFQSTMLRDRSKIETPDELAVIVHVDGQGSLGSKYATWDQMLSDPTAADQQLWWGWKNFIDEDNPTATPAQVDAVDPLPVVVTYQ